MASVDHLVIMATSLAQGVAWCEATLGVTPGPGGEHPLMGTHNRLLNISSPHFAGAYLEIIAINPIATPSIPARARRWFDMDDLALRAHVERHGPTLTHCVAKVPDVTAAVAALATQGIDRGVVVQASRQTASGLLQWQITVREDGQRLFDGCLPTLIQWGSTHPTDTMPKSDLVLQRMQVRHPQAAALDAAYRAIGLAFGPASAADPVVVLGPARLSAQLQTPKGLVEIHTP